MIKKLLLAISLALMCALGCAMLTMADTVTVDITSSDEDSCATLLDNDYFTMNYFNAGTVLTVNCDVPMDGIYIKFDNMPGTYSVSAGGQTVTCGTNGFLHEYVQLPVPSNTAEITISQDTTYITDVYGVSGEIPGWVQTWQPPYNKADILYFSTHSDDDVLFFGGLIPTYVNAGMRVQAAYMVDHGMSSPPYGDEPYRTHELLDCIWTMGLRHYPQLGRFGDWYSENLEDAEEAQSIEDVTGYVVETIRRFKPQVVISQDFEGEYGHGQHMLLAAATAKAVEITNDPTQYMDSATQYGLWDVPKTYYHLFDQYVINIPDRVPLDFFGGMTALDVAKSAYLCHQSQQWMWYYVSDGFGDDGVTPDPKGDEIACNRFGLYRTLVGEDTGTDIMENLIPYDLQAPDEPKPGPGGEEITGEENTDVYVETTSDNKSIVDGKEKTKKSNTVLVIIIVIGALFVLVAIFAGVMAILKAQKKKKREAARRRRLEAQRRRNQ